MTESKNEATGAEYAVSHEGRYAQVVKHGDLYRVYGSGGLPIGSWLQFEEAKAHAIRSVGCSP